MLPYMDKLVLFDVDGTLLHTAGAGRRAIRAALLPELGSDGPIDGVRFDGKTDPQIVRELLVAARHPEPNSDAVISAVCDRYLRLLEREFAAGTRRPTVYPGVRVLLDRLEARGDTLLGLLTGNLAQGARMKLDAAGLSPDRFRIGAFGSDHHDRARLPPIAAARARRLMGRVPIGAEVIIIGDTPADMTCGSALGVRAIGVATGRFTTDELRMAGGFEAFPDLAETERVLAAIYA